MVSISAQQAARWAQASADQKLTPQEYQQIQQAYLQENPQASAADADAHFLHLLGQGAEGSAEQKLQAEAMLGSLKIGSAVLVQPFFAEAQPAEPAQPAAQVTFSAQGLSLTDIDGLEQNSKQDLRGSAERLEVNLPLQTADMKRMLQGLVSDLEGSASEWINNKIGNVAPTDIPDDLVPASWNDPESWSSWAYGALKGVEYGVEGVANFFSGTWNAGAELVAGQAGKLTQSMATNMAQSSEITFETQDGRSSLKLALELPILGKTTAATVSSDAQGRLVLAPFPDHDYLRGTVQSFLLEDVAASSQPADTPEPSADGRFVRQLTQGSVEMVQGWLQSYGIEADLSLNDAQRLVLTPKAMTLTQEVAQKILGPEQAARFQAQELKLSPEQFSLKLTENGLQVSLQQVALSGSSDLNGLQAVASDAAASLELERGQGAVSLGPDGEVQAFSLSEIKGRLQGQTRLDNQTIDMIQQTAAKALSDIDTYLQRHGLGRDQVAAVLAQIPKNIFEGLMQSTSQGDITKVAQEFGVDGSTLTQTLAFLRDQPVQQMVRDLSSLTELVGKDTEIRGEAGFELGSLQVERQGQQWVTQLAQVGANLNLQLENPAGVKTDLQLTAGLAQAQIEPGQMAFADAELSLSGATNPAPAASSSPQQQLEAFMADLRRSGDFVVPAGPRAGYLHDEGPDKIRLGQGISAQRALASLEKLGVESFLALNQRSAAERQAIYREQGIEHGDYLLKYLNRYVLPQSSDPAQSGSRFAASAAVSAATLRPDGPSTILDPRLSAELQTQSEQGRTDLAMTLQSEHLYANGERLSAGPITAQSRAEITEADQTRTTAELTLGASGLETVARPASPDLSSSEKISHFRQQLQQQSRHVIQHGHRQGYLVDEGSQKIRQQLGLKADSAQQLLARVEPQAWLDLLQNPAERPAFYRQHGIVPNQGDYLLNYLQRYVLPTDHSRAAVADLALQDVSLNADVLANGQQTVRASVAAEAETLYANGHDIGLSGVQTAPQGIRFEQGNTHFTAGVESLEISANPQGIQLQTELDWALQTRQPGTEVQLNGHTGASIQDSQILGTASQVSGQVKTTEQTLLRLLQARPELRSFANYLQQQRILSQQQVQIQVQSQGPILTGAEGQVSAYDVGVKAAKVQTSVGPASLNFSASTGGAVSGQISIQSQPLLEQALKQALNTQLQAALGPGSKQPGIATVRVQDGKLQLGLDEKNLEELQISIQPKNGKLELSVDEARIRGAFQRFFAGVFGIDPKDVATDTINKALASFNATRIDGKYSLEIPTQAILAEVMGQELGSQLRITPSIRGSEISLHFAHQP